LEHVSLLAQTEHVLLPKRATHLVYPLLNRHRRAGGILERSKPRVNIFDLFINRGKLGVHLVEVRLSIPASQKASASRPAIGIAVGGRLADGVEVLGREGAVVRRLAGLLAPHAL
jgi:hypothetical protein